MEYLRKGGRTSKQKRYRITGNFLGTFLQYIINTWHTLARRLEARSRMTFSYSLVLSLSICLCEELPRLRRPPAVGVLGVLGEVGVVTKYVERAISSFVDSPPNSGIATADVRG